MPRTALTVQQAKPAGITIAWAAATANDAVVAGLGRILLVQNTSAAAITVTIPSNTTVDSLVLPDRTITVGAGAIEAISLGPSPAEGIEADGTVWINYSTTTGVNVAYIGA